MLAFGRKVHWRTLSFRAGAVLVSLVVTLFMTYGIGVNALLLTGVGKAALNRMAPAHVHFEWHTAYSPWFFRVRTTRFAIRSEDSAVQWLITADRANASLGPLDFFSRRVRLHDLQASGLSTRIRFKLDPAEATPDYVARLPSIAGFADPPLKPAVPPPPVTDDNYRLWTVEIDDAVAESVREVWVDTIRVTDTGGRAEGGFYLKPLRRLFVRPTEVRTQDAGVFDGKDTIASELQGRFGLYIAEVDLTDADGAEMLEHLDAKTNARTKVGDLRFLNRWLHHAHIAVEGGAGPSQFSVDVQRGQLVSGSHAWARSDGWSLRSNRNGFTGTSFVSARVPEGKPHLAVTTETYDLGIHHDKTIVARAPAVAASARIDNVDMTKPFDRWSVSIDVPSATAKDLKALNGYLDTPVLYAGSATLKGHADITPHTVSGHAKVDVSNTKLEIDKTLVTASGTIEASLHDFDLRSKRGSLAGATIILRNVSGADQSGWWADFSANPLSIGLGDGVSLSGMITGRFKNGQLPLAILDAPGIVRTVFGSQSFAMSAHARLSSGAIDLTDLRIIGNSIEARAHYHGTNGAVFVEAPFVNVGVLIRNGESSTHLFVTRDWYARTLRQDWPQYAF